MTENAVNILILVIIAAILAAVIAYIVRAKKQGAKCIGCPYAKSCGKCGSGGCGKK